MMNVEVEIGKLQAEVATLKSEQAVLRSENSDMKRMLNQGRGAVWVLGGLAAIIGFLLTQWKSVVETFK